MYSLEFHAKVLDEDLRKMSDEVFEEVVSCFRKYIDNPFKYSSKLYNLDGINLEGYRKTYVANATYRIIIKIENRVAKIVEVVAVGKRAGKEVYKEAFARIKK